MTAISIRPCITALYIDQSFMVCSSIVLGKLLKEIQPDRLYIVVYTELVTTDLHTDALQLILKRIHHTTSFEIIYRQNGRI